MLSAGSSGQLLQSNGAGAPSWTTLSTLASLTVGSITVNSGFNFAGLANKTATYVLTSTDSVIASSCPLNTSLVDTLPAASALKGQVLTISKVDRSTQTVTINAAGSDTIGTSTTTVVLYAPGQTLDVISDGVSNWIVRKAPVQPDYLGVARAAQSAAAVSVSSDTHCQSFYTPEFVAVKGMAFTVGTQGGTFDMGIYDRTGTLLASAGNTTLPATGNRTASFTSTAYLAPGQYWKCTKLVGTVGTLTREGPDGTLATCQFSSTTGTMPSTLAVSGCSASNRVFVSPVMLYGSPNS